jgi:hypothetical protein
MYIMPLKKKGIFPLKKQGDFPGFMRNLICFFVNLINSRSLNIQVKIN